MKVRLTIDIPEHVKVTREDLSTVAADAFYTPSGRMLKALKVGKKAKSVYGNGIVVRWKAVDDGGSR